MIPVVLIIARRQVATAHLCLIRRNTCESCGNNTKGHSHIAKTEYGSKGNNSNGSFTSRETQKQTRDSLCSD